MMTEAERDLQRIDFRNGDSVGLYGVQPRESDAMWMHNRPIQATHLTCGGNDRGGYISHGARIYAPKGKKCETAIVRLCVGESLDERISEYRRENALTRLLDDKVKDKTLVQVGTWNISKGKWLGARDYGHD